MPRIVLVSLFIVGLISCSSGNNDPSGSGNPVNTDLEIVANNALVDTFFSAFDSLYQAQNYAMFIVIGDVVTNDTTPNTLSGETIKCLDLAHTNRGTFSINLQDNNANGAIDAGESSTVIFTNCYGTSSAPVNGTLLQDLHAFDAVIDPATLFATDITQWNATYTFSNNFSRVDADSGESFAFDGKVTFDYTNFKPGSTLTTTAENLSATNQGKTVYMPNLSIAHDSSFDPNTDNMTISGSFSDAKLGLVSVTSDQLKVENATSNTSKLTGTLTFMSASTTLSLNFFDWNDIIMSLDSNNDGVVDKTWTYNPGGQPPVSSLIGVWDTARGGVMTVTSSEITFTESGQVTKGSYVDDSISSQHRLIWTIAQDTTNTAPIGTKFYCIYEFTGDFTATFACSDQNVASYPASIFEATSYIDLTLQ